ncbi:tetraacyldisaccharide 4'-kinase [Ferruginibacter albus]|uniref:tetraacyldisaccharide 4'-kinase n=1 Tax=Ferruginibacter albus TaxID=2875540 RepID=UPI001CC76135|nr:tetraacyldisaccharide 4'-kinase [Ferruginibacter albus]UAY50651.1 tetraacyldisaccharide 4'-kinase [Ferruginibacter albus]
MLKSFRYLLIPFSIVYGGIIMLRNWLYNKNYLKSATFNFPIICVGNLAVGGTGKTPMTEYLIRFLKGNYKTATLSRGYKRKTKGFAIANEKTTALEIGDEPMQFHQKFPDITVSVGEERLVAIPQLLHDRPETQVIILDDAFQHRQINAGLNIILTEYKNLYTRDLMMPAGDLRDIRFSARRAHIIIVSKCPDHLSLAAKDELIKELDPQPHQQVFFTGIRYGMPYHLFNRTEISITQDTAVLLICGIANPKPLKDHLTATVLTYDMLRFNDHHIFNTDDLSEIKKQFEKISSANKIILTTEKDAVRLQKFERELKDYPLYAIPIEHSFLFDKDTEFNALITAFIETYKD